MQALLRTVGLEAGGDIDPSFLIRDEDSDRLFEGAAAAEADATTLLALALLAASVEESSSAGISRRAEVGAGG